MLLLLLAGVVTPFHIGMYSVRGFPFLSFPTSLAGLAMPSRLAHAERNQAARDRRRSPNRQELLAL